MVIKLSINDYCKSCGLCVYVCQREVLIMGDRNEDGITTVMKAEGKKCVGCGDCFQVCPDSCLEAVVE